MNRIIFLLCLLLLMNSKAQGTKERIACIGNRENQLTRLQSIASILPDFPGKHLNLAYAIFLD